MRKIVVPRHPIYVTLHHKDNFHGCLIVHWDPLNAKRSCRKKWYELFENAWFPWQPIADLRMGVCLQNYSYLISRMLLILDY